MHEGRLKWIQWVSSLEWNQRCIVNYCLGLLILSVPTTVSLSCPQPRLYCDVVRWLCSLTVKPQQHRQEQVGWGCRLWQTLAQYSQQQTGVYAAKRPNLFGRLSIKITKQKTKHVSVLKSAETAYMFPWPIKHELCADASVIITVHCKS